MLEDDDIRWLRNDPSRAVINSINNNVARCGISPDWVIAGLNCTDDKDILPVCIHTYLMDWRPE
jgi:hypothetical protein